MRQQPFTKLPWTSSDRIPESGDIPIIDAAGEVVGQIRLASDAEYIIDAANNYNEVITLLETIDVKNKNPLIEKLIRDYLKSKGIW